MNIEKNLLSDLKLADAILKTVGALVIVLDETGRIVLFNPACQTLTGYTEDEALGRYPWDFLLPNAVKENVKNVFSRLVSGDFPNQYENAWLTKDGAERMISWSNTAICYPDSSVQYVIATGIDITERAKAVADLEASREWFSKIVEESPVATVITDREGNITLFNRKFINSYGWTIDDVRTPEEWWPAAYPDPGYRAQVITSWEKAVEEAFANNAEIAPQRWSLTCKNGDVRDVIFQMVSVSDDTSVITMNDITDQVRAIEERRKSDERFKRLANLTREGLILGRDGNVIDSNKSVEDMFGYSHEDFLRLKPEDIIAPEDIHTVRHNIHNNVEGAYEVTAIKSDGSPFPIELRARIIEEGGESIRVTCIHDISERKAIEERAAIDAAEDAALSTMLHLSLEETEMRDYLQRAIEMLLDTVPWLNLLPAGGIFLTDPTTEPHELVLAAHHNLAPSLETLCARVPFGTCLCGRAAAQRGVVYEDCVNAHHHITFPGITDHGHYNIPILHDDEVLGVIVLYLPPGHPKKDSDVSFLQRIASVFSMGIQARHSRNKLKSSKEQADFANRSKTEFLANMSHELRTPLNSIIGFSQMLKDQTFGPLGNPTIEEYVDIINGAGNHLLTIIGDILDLSKIEAGEEQLMEEPIDVAQVAELCLAMMHAKATAKEITLHHFIEDNLPQLRCDGIKLKQVLLNLLSNATKFTSTGGDITLKADLSDERAISVHVIDNGIGIAPEDIVVVTNPFEQIGDAMTRHKEGSGLGLALSKRLIELHDGTLHIESELDKGTTVTITFPSARSL